MNPLDVLYPPPSYFDLTALKLSSISEEDNEDGWSKEPPPPPPMLPLPPILAFATPLPDRRRNSAPPAVEQREQNVVWYSKILGYFLLSKPSDMYRAT